MTLPLSIDSEPDPSSDRLLTKRQLATRLQISTRQVERLVRRGLYVRRLGSSPRFLWPEVLEQLKKWAENEAKFGRCRVKVVKGRVA
jgi:hypothetical protein